MFFLYKMLTQKSHKVRSVYDAIGLVLLVYLQLLTITKTGSVGFCFVETFFHCAIPRFTRLSKAEQEISTHEPRLYTNKPAVLFHKRQYYSPFFMKL